MPTNETNGGKSLLPAPRGNQRARQHGAYVQVFSAEENAELASIEQEVAELCPVDSPSVRPVIGVMASLLWRQRRLVQFLNESGFVRGRSDRTQVQPAVEALAVIERQLVTTAQALAMLPREAPALGLQLKKLEASRFDWTRLSAAEKKTVDELIAKAETTERGWPDAS